MPKAVIIGPADGTGKRQGTVTQDEVQSDGSVVTTHTQVVQPVNPDGSFSDSKDLVYLAQAILDEQRLRRRMLSLLANDAVNALDVPLAATAFWKGDSQLATNPEVNGFRLTLTSGTPITTADVTGATSIYWMPAKATALTATAFVALYYNSTWALYSTAGITIPVGTVTSGANYDLFAYFDGTTVRVEKSNAWTSDTVQADALAVQDGIEVKSSDHTRRYIGTFRTTSTTTTEDSAAKRFLWNNQNQAWRTLIRQETTSSWAYTTAAWRQANGAAANKVEYVTGDPGALLDVTALNYGNSTVAIAFGGAAGVGVDSTTVNSAQLTGGSFATSVTMQYSGYYRGTPGRGYHALNWLEFGGTGGRFYGVESGATGTNCGMVGRVLA